MREQLIRDVEALFTDAVNAEEIKQEILQNTLDRYDDLIAQGRIPEAAYNLSLSSIGDISEIFYPYESSTPATKSHSPVRKTVTNIILTTGLFAYLAISLISSAWHITWIMFPIMAAAQGLARAIIDLKEGC